ncbi:MAG: PPC domain-containing protein [Planctomycetota bacterium]
MRTTRYLSLLALAMCIATAWGQQAQKAPHIAYLYPGGGRQGTVFEVTVGGQLLRGASDVHVTGEGIRVNVIEYYRPIRNLQQDQRQELMRRLKAARDKRIAELPPEKVNRRALMFPGEKFSEMDMTMQAQKDDEPMVPAVELPGHPLLRNLESKGLRELWHIADLFLNYKHLQRMQLNTQLAELLLIEVTIDPNAAPGDRELRLITPLGLTNPMCFQVGTLPEVNEKEPNEPRIFDPLPKDPPLDLPVVLNGQITPGDLDRFRFRAKRGQQLVIETFAQHLVPFLADAVPGWFQATVALYDAKGREVAFADDYRFRPDPVLHYEIPEDGEYELEIRDSIYRGREDFVYRVAVGELPFITQMFPLGGQTGAATIASIDGWHLPSKQLPLDTQPGGESIRQTALRQGGSVSNDVVYAVDALPECYETEPNDDVKSAQRIALPAIVNGRIIRPGDVDVFQFQGRAGGEVVAEVHARRLYSPLDSLLRLTDASGTVLAWNDDLMQKDGDLHRDMGLLTHHADSYLTARLPKDGTYYVHLTDAQNHGDGAYGYRLRISPPQPDFALRMTPSSLSVLAGRVVPITVHTLRKDGFAGDIDVALKDPSSGFTLSGGRIPSGRDRISMTLTAPGAPSKRPVPLHLEGRAQIGGQPISRPVVPSEDVMQAFLYRHLVPSENLLIAVIKSQWKPPALERVGSGPVRVPAGGTAEVRVRSTSYLRPPRLQLHLIGPPEGVSIQDVRAIPEGMAFHLKVEGPAAKAGFADNLIVEAITDYANKKKVQKGGKTPQKQHASIGVLPAIPFEVVQP